MDETDELDEALQGVTQVGMTAAARAGEQLARAREERVRQAQARSEQDGREVTARLHAERDAARAALAPVHRPEWWDGASATEVTRAFETATAWRGLDQEAATAADRIVEEVRQRYGVDVAGGTAALEEALERAAMARSAEREQRAAAADDRAEAAALMAAVDAGDRAGEGREDAGHVYDSAERREALAESLRGVGNDAAVEARVRADVAQGLPATAAVRPPAAAPRARRARATRQAGRQAQRTERGR